MFAAEILTADTELAVSDCVRCGEGPVGCKRKFVMMVCLEFLCFVSF